jgi:hypothetical protein
VSNNSWGGPRLQETPFAALMLDRGRRGRGILNVFAAGNQA